ncbi:hypothetical protein AAFN90_20175 [Erwiniaceae bacterium CAU 1747]
MKGVGVHGSCLFIMETSYSIEYQKEHFWRCRYTSTESPALHYKIILPLYIKPVVTAPQEIDGLGVTLIGLYRTVKEKPYVEVSVSCENIKNEINSSDWLYNVLDLMGEIIVNKKEFFVDSGSYADVLTWKDYNGETMISRYRVMKDSDAYSGGANFFMIKATCHVENYNSLAEDIFQCVAWVELINKSNWSMAEGLKSLNETFPERLYFYYPNSWSLRRTEEKRDNFVRYVLSHEIDNVRVNLINIFFMQLDHEVTAQFVCDILSRRLKKILETDVLVPRKLEQAFNMKINELWVSESEVSGKEEEGVSGIKIYIGRIKNLWFYLEMITPLHTQNFYQWAVNKRTVDIILNSVNNHDLEFNPDYSGEVFS